MTLTELHTSDTVHPDRAVLLDRLSRRGKLSITVEDGLIEVRIEPHGPWVGGRCTTDKHDLFDLFEHCRLGAKRWQGEGFDLDALLVLCEMESRPDNHDIDDLVWSIECRRDSRTYGPPLPSFTRWKGWRPGMERWLTTFHHKHEYLDGYKRDLRVEREFEAERAAMEARAALPRIPRRVTKR